MKKLMRILVLMTVILALGSLSASAHGWRGRGYYADDDVRWGISVGPDWWGPEWGSGWGPYPYYNYYNYPPPVIVQQPSDMYVLPQREPPPAEPSYWYYCPDPKGYYPYVKKCPKGWMKVVPQTTPPEGE